MTQFLRDQASDREEVVTPLMLDGTYLSRNFATLGPFNRQPPCDASSKINWRLTWDIFFIPGSSRTQIDYEKNREPGI